MQMTLSSAKRDRIILMQLNIHLLVGPIGSLISGGFQKDAVLIFSVWIFWPYLTFFNLTAYFWIPKTSNEFQGHKAKVKCFRWDRQKATWKRFSFVDKNHFCNPSQCLSATFGIARWIPSDTSLRLLLAITGFRCSWNILPVVTYVFKCFQIFTLWSCWDFKSTLALICAIISWARAQHTLKPVQVIGHGTDKNQLLERGDLWAAIEESILGMFGDTWLFLFIYEAA